MLVKISSGPMSIMDLYEIVTMKMGEDPKMVKNYDCRKINVAQNIFDDIYEWYQINVKGDVYVIKQHFGMDWLMYGPKVDNELPDNCVVLEDGFMSFEEY